MIKILIVEDDLISAKELAYQLQLHQCEVVAIASTAEQAIADFEKHEPHLLFIDINLKGEKTGIDVAEYVNQKCRVPFIYLSDHFGKDNPYFKRANASLPSNYLPKGAFLPSHIWHFVEVAFGNYIKAGGFYINENESNVIIRNNIFVKTNASNIYEKIETQTITHLLYNKPYTDVYRNESDKKATIRIRKSIDYTIEQLNAAKLVRIHKSHAVNIDAIVKYDSAKCIVYLSNDVELEVGRTFKPALENHLRLIG
jgi:DNA-binding LytR/AlgR family response regulator